MPMAARCLMSRKSALGFACTSFASSSAFLGPCRRWSATPSLAATYRACVVLYPCVKLKSSCLGDSIDPVCLLSFCLETVVKTDYLVALDSSIIFQSSGVLVDGNEFGR